MTTLAQDYLERGYVYGDEGRTMKNNFDAIIRSQLAPIGTDPSRAKSYAEQFVFDEEVPAVVGDLVRGGHVDLDMICSMSHLPSDSTWMEWPITINDAIGCRFGVLIVKDCMRMGELRRPGAFFIMRTQKDGLVGCFGAIAMPFPMDMGAKVLAIPFWKDWCVKDDDERSLPDDIAKDAKSFVWDVIDGLFLIMTPRVCEIRHSDFSGKLNRRRIASGRLPLVEYKKMVLKVGIGQPRYVRSAGGPAPLVADHREGSHKRLHRVIGHFRTYRANRETAKVSFVPQHWRGDAELGVVLHTRHVKGEDK